MNRDFFYLNTSGDKFEVFEENIHFVPIINQKTKQLEDILFLDGQSRQNKYHEQALIMAGGFGKRLRPLTNDVPKPMLEIAGIPLLEITINYLKSLGIKKILILHSTCLKR